MDELSKPIADQLRALHDPLGDQSTIDGFEAEGEPGLGREGVMHIARTRYVDSDGCNRSGHVEILGDLAPFVCPVDASPTIFTRDALAHRHRARYPLSAAERIVVSHRRSDTSASAALNPSASRRAVTTLIPRSMSSIRLVTYANPTRASGSAKATCPPAPSCPNDAGVR